MIHLVCGPTASGKTRLAKEIESARGAIRFSIDELMEPPNFPEQRDDYFIAQLVQKARPMFIELLKAAEQSLSQGNEVVLDVGAFHRETRDVVRTWASENKQPLTLHYLSFSRDIRLERLRQRNERRGSNYSFNVPQWVFDLIEQIFEPPTDEEKPMIVYR